MQGQGGMTGININFKYVVIYMPIYGKDKIHIMTTTMVRLTHPKP